MITCRLLKDGGLKREIPFDAEAIRGVRRDDQRDRSDAIDCIDEELSAGLVYRTFPKHDWL